MFTQFQNYAQKNVGTTAATLLTCPASQQYVVNQLSCANTTALPVTVSVNIIRSANVVYVVRNAIVNPGGSLACAGIDQKIVLMAGDQLQVQSSAASSIDVIVSGVLNDYNPAATVPVVPVSPVATFSITPDNTTINEGVTVTYTVSTTNVPNGTQLYWENLGTTTGDDFTDGLNTGGPFTISSGNGSFTRTLRNNDSTTEGSQTIIMAVRFGEPPYGGLVATAATVTVADQDNIVTSGLTLHLDASRLESYPGNGTSWYSIGTSGGLVTQGGPYMPQYTTIKGVQCFNFNQIGAYFTKAGLFATPFPADGTNLTLDVWFYPATSELIGTERGNLVRGTATNSWYMSWNKTTRQQSNYWYGKVPEGYHESGAAITRGTWNNVVAVWNSTTLSQFLNGTKTTVGTTGTTSNKSTDIQIGWEGDDRQFHGGIAVIKIYSTALSDAQVAQNFNALRYRFGI